MIFKEKRSTNSIIAWILILYLAPYVGFIVFILIGRKMNNANMFGFKNAELNTFKSYVNKNEEKNKYTIYYDSSACHCGHSAVCYVSVL